MTVTEKNTTQTEPIDTQDTIADVELGAEPGIEPSEVDVRIKGTADADYVIELSDGRNIFFEQASPTASSSVAERFSTPHARLRVRVTTAAANGETADVLVGVKPD
jgi:YbbR domain-containing protein